MVQSLALRRSSVFALTAALAAAALWLWTNFCGFPWSPWNDVRLAPVFMAATGAPVYPLPHEGVLTTWLYGPAPLWLWWPATLARDVVSAVVTAGALNIAYTAAAIAIVCWLWPAPHASRATRLLAFTASIAIWPYSSLVFLQADNVALACGLVANTALVSRRGQTGPTGGWLIALVTALALASKQTSLGLLAAQIAWLWSEGGRGPAIGHLVRTGAATAALAIAAIAQFGFERLWFGMIEVPGRLPWTHVPGLRLWDLLPYLLVHFGAPIAILLFASKRVLSRGHPLRLPFFAWIGSLPLGIAGMMTAGGTLNSFQGFCLLLPPVLVVACAATSRRPAWFLGFAGLTLGLFALRWPAVANRPLTPAVTALRQAEQICGLYPGQIWFPWNPTVTYFAEGRFYHAEDGLYVRQLTGLGVSSRQFHDGLPPRITYVALFGSSWKIALSFTRGDRFEQHLGYWELWRWQEP